MSTPTGSAFRAVRQPLALVGLTWLFWLYLSPQIWVTSRAADASKSSSQVELESIKINTPQAAFDKLSSSNKASELEPDRLELDLSLRRVFLYQADTQIASFPVAVGRKGWETPQGHFRVMQMIEKPTWINPFTEQAIPGGDPDNPLGDYWIGFWTNGRDWIGFHGTPSPQLVGQAVSHGCVRMRNEDVGNLFQKVGLGVQVIVKP